MSAAVCVPVCVSELRFTSVSFSLRTFKVTHVTVNVVSFAWWGAGVVCMLHVLILRVCVRVCLLFVFL